jgi:hypothetical protein
MGTKMGKETMLLEEAFAITHGAMMTFDEDALVGSVIGPRRYNAGCGKRAWAHGIDVSRRSKVWKLRKKRAQLVEPERTPIGLDQRAVHAVRFSRE